MNGRSRKVSLELSHVEPQQREILVPKNQKADFV